MPCSSTRNWSIENWLSPVCCLQVEDNQVGKVCSVLVLSSEDEKLVSLVEVRRVAFKHNISRVTKVGMQQCLPILTPGMSP